MKPRSVRLSLLASLALVAASAGILACDLAAEGSFHRSLKVTGPVDLEVVTDSGRIAVRTGEESMVRVSGRIRAYAGWFDGRMDADEKIRRVEADPPIDQNGNVIRIGHILDEDLRRHLSISYEIEVPAETRLRAKTASGSQVIEGIGGALEVSTGSGGLTISRIGSEVRASTGSGSIEIHSVRGKVRASTGSGSIRALDIAGGVDASTGSGSIRIEQTAQGDVEVRTGSGRIEVENVHGGLRAESGSASITVQGEPTAEWRLRAGSGNITVRLPANVACDLNARTSSGRIHSDHPVTLMGTLGKNRLQGKVRGGGVLIDLHASSGDIRIE